MIRRKNSIVRLVTCAVLMAILLCSAALPALAADYAEGTSATDPAKAAITKVFKMPINTASPAATFTFTITKVGVDAATDAATRALMPNLGTNGTTTVSFTAGATQTFIDAGTKYYVLQTADIMAGIPTNGSAWAAGPGIYKYTINEVPGGITPTPILTDTEYMYYSPAIYDLEVWVEEDANGILFAMYIVGYYRAGTPDEYYPGTPGTGKLDPTPGTTVPGTPPQIQANYSDLIFTNRYWKTDGDPDPDPDPDVSALEIKKLVGGINPNTGTYFSFAVTVVTPAAAGDPTSTVPKTYNAYVVDAAGAYVDLDVATNPNTKTGSDALNRDYITFTSNVARTVSLKHGERLVFFTLEVGAEARAAESIPANTRVKYTRTFGTSPNTDFVMPTGTTGTWGFPGASADAGPHYTISGAGANIATFTNTMSSTPPTGITVDNLPFVVLIAVAVIGLIAFVLIKYRKRAKQDV